MPMPNQQAPQGAPQADPRAQGIAQRLVLAAQKIIYAQGVSQQLLAMIKQVGDPVQGIVHAALMVIDQLRERTKGIDPNVVYAVAPAVIGMLIEIADAAGLVKANDQIAGQAKQALLQVIQQRVGGQGAQAPQPGAAPAPSGAGPAPQPGLIGAMGG